MPDLVEHMYSSHQITIPPTLPTVLKKYAKAAIRTQPRDLLIWSSAYFKALTYGIPLPAKGRLEYPPVQTISGLSPGYLRVLINQIGNNAVAVIRADIEAYWKGICLSEEALEEICAVGGFGLKLNWFKFIAICAGYLESSLTRTMILLCELLTEEPSGGSAYLPIHKFIYLYKYLARLDCGPNEPIKVNHPIHKPTDTDLHEVGDPLSGSEIGYKEGEALSSESISAISWQSVLKRMGKRESDLTVCTLDRDNKIYENDSVSRGIAWQRIAEIAESEPDTSDTIMQSECYASSMGLQVFEYVEDKKLKKRVIDPNKPEEEKEEKNVSRSESIVDITRLGQKSLDEMLGLVQEFETTSKIKKTETVLDNDEEESKSESSPGKISPHGSEVEDFTEQTNDELRELVKPDSSMILVPTPPVYGEDDQSMNDDITELEDDEGYSDESVGLKVGNISLVDVHVPDVEIPELINLEEEIPKTYFQEPKWVHIPGIGPKISEEQIKRVEIYMRDCAEKQAGAVMPRNIRHFQCPPLDLTEAF